MPQYFSPGVYVEEVDSGPRPIQGVSTSVTGAVGVTSRGPSDGKPVLVTSYNEFTRIFGGPLDDPPAALQNQWNLDDAEGGRWWQFALAVKGFFDNGGQQLFAKRVFSGATNGAQAAAVNLERGVISELTADAAPTDTTLQLRTLVGIAVGTTLNIHSNGQSLAANPFTVDAYTASGEVTLNNAPGQELLAGRDFVELVAFPRQAAANANQRITVSAKSVGEWGGTAANPASGVSVRVGLMVGATLQLMADPVVGGPAATTLLNGDAVAAATTITVISDAGFSPNDIIRIRGQQYTVAAVPGGNILDISPATVSPGGWPDGTSVTRLRFSNTAATSPTLHVSGASSLYPNALIELDNGTVKERLRVATINGTEVTFHQNVVNTCNETHPLRVIEAEVNAIYQRDGDVEVDESFTNFRLVDDGSFSDIVRHVNDRSQLINLERGSGYPANFTELINFPSVATATPETHFARLTAGTDAYGVLTVDDFVGTDGGSGNRTGVQALEDIDDISLVLLPGMWSGTIRDAVVRHCEAMKYRIAIIDSPPEQDIQEIRAFRAPIDTRFAALYYPWIVVRNAAQQRFDTIAPSASMAGIYSRVDAARGFHKAPANEVINGIRQPNPATQTGGIEQDITRREQDLLNPNGINALRYFPGRGQRVWGARTLSSDSNWRYVNVRRIFTFIEKSIDEGTQWVVFEPNDQQLWARVRQTIRNFLETQWRNGVLEGRTADEAFFVACDRGVTMSQDDIENGRLICEVGIAPVYPAEFVIFRISKYTAESKLS
jgi:phage tail sheath protein FI